MPTSYNKNIIFSTDNMSVIEVFLILIMVIEIEFLRSAFQEAINRIHPGNVIAEKL